VRVFERYLKSELLTGPFPPQSTSRETQCARYRCTYMQNPGTLDVCLPDDALEAHQRAISSNQTYLAADDGARWSDTPGLWGIHRPFSRYRAPGAETSARPGNLQSRYVRPAVVEPWRLRLCSPGSDINLGRASLSVDGDRSEEHCSPSLCAAPGKLSGARPGLWPESMAQQVQVGECNVVIVPTQGSARTRVRSQIPWTTHLLLQHSSAGIDGTLPLSGFKGETLPGHFSANVRVHWSLPGTTWLKDHLYTWFWQPAGQGVTMHSLDQARSCVGKTRALQVLALRKRHQPPQLQRMSPYSCSSPLAFSSKHSCGPTGRRFWPGHRSQCPAYTAKRQRLVSDMEANERTFPSYHCAF